jgi:hypothetical protein
MYNKPLKLKKKRLSKAQSPRSIQLRSSLPWKTQMMIFQLIQKHCFPGIKKTTRTCMTKMTPLFPWMINKEGHVSLVIPSRRCQTSTLILNTTRQIKLILLLRSWLSLHALMLLTAFLKSFPIFKPSWLWSEWVSQFTDKTWTKNSALIVHPCKVKSLMQQHSNVFKMNLPRLTL